MTAPAAASLNFRVDARAILQLGRQSIRDHTTALVELVKNAYDADASIVEIDIQTKRKLIRVADNGSGMSIRDFKTKWLRIGFSEKRRRRRSPSGSRVVVGEKGVGRISADRLGAVLELRTLAPKSQPFGARIDWNAFDVEGKELHQIPIERLSLEQPTLPPPRKHTPSGTELRISALRQEWLGEDISRLRDELSRLLSPWADVEDFRIVLRTDIEGVESGDVESHWDQQAELEVEAELWRGSVKLTLTNHTARNKSVDRRTMKKRWVDMVADARLRGRRLNAPTAGPVTVRLFYMPRRALQLASGGLSMNAIRERVLGVRVFRDGIRLRPYGDLGQPEGDWLTLAARKARDPSGVARESYVISPTELAGAVFIARHRNPGLIDSAGREGLIDNEAFRDLRDFVLACVKELERLRVDAERVRRGAEIMSDVQTKVEKWRALSNEAQEKLSNLRTTLARTTPETAATLDTVIELSREGQREAEASVDLLVDQQRVFRGLASVGIATSVFGHETQTALTKCTGSLREALASLGEAPPNIPDATRFTKQATANAERVGAWGRFAIARVRSDKRKRRLVHVDVVAREIIRDFEPAYAALQTELKADLEPAQLRTFTMDIEAVVINLLTNAYAFVQQSRRPRCVRLEVRAKQQERRRGVEITVADSGPGVHETDRARIWEPLVTTRRDLENRDVGTGLGLAIVDSIVREHKGTRAVTVDKVLRGARFAVWLSA